MKRKSQLQVKVKERREDNFDLIETNELSRTAMGGTELMARRIYGGAIPRDLLKNFQIIFSRVRDLDPKKLRILYVHDLPEDGEIQKALSNEGWQRFHLIVFVSNWQMQRFIEKYGLPWDRCRVVLNSIEPLTSLPDKQRDVIKLVYTSTPHRGLELLLPVFKKLRETRPVTLDVFSSFGIYGWPERDEPFRPLFDAIKDTDGATWHGSVPNEEVREFLSQEAHVFAYPSTWQETSCLCLIEAMQAGLDCVHPDFAALPETSANWTKQYHWTPDQAGHMNRLLSVLDLAVSDAMENTQEYQNSLQSQASYARSVYGWDRKAQEWEALLMSLIDQPRGFDDIRVFRYEVR